ncbi:hypothetical protein AVDCRST_MAG92-4371 [uncultured Coleofasciculus sp.]|uniref:Uncharacterized protein n=1 Tax=uncultured Coleofasciculus sp. TaxID=1267456 RepID=A0A6J4JZW2_9CYAN|nr:hypothetical protein AVDCRST_MAG92-4371 [uncultured Coleofasciculus sp.]
MQLELDKFSFFDNGLNCRPSTLYFSDLFTADCLLANNRQEIARRNKSQACKFFP